MKSEEILKKLPYSQPFLFVDEIISINENGVEGNFTFNEKMDFFKGHFKNYPVTPGVILTECMAQIGLVCLGIYLIKNLTDKSSVALTSTQIEFLKPVYPNEKVTVISEKIYFRFNKLKCKVFMKNQKNEIVCEGLISGFVTE
ncbi:MAG: hydroxymyristoyl-ACP dehydratase [Chryseobacterium sp.]|nr:hydroxymyristoyl-ACP dehydratase [Chryseobacterium sp.]